MYINAMLWYEIARMTVGGLHIYYKIIGALFIT